LADSDSTVNCDQLAPKAYSHAAIGASTNGTGTCATPDSCATVAVEATTWGGVKALYR
jgi:hypothetical protein